ncbi:hypothetical protein THAOC_20731, partial [Thalassiosira oceanica]
MLHCGGGQYNPLPFVDHVSELLCKELVVVVAGLVRPPLQGRVDPSGRDTTGERAGRQYVLRASWAERPRFVDAILSQRGSGTRAIKKKGSRRPYRRTKISNLTKLLCLLCGPIRQLSLEPFRLDWGCTTHARRSGGASNETIRGRINKSAEQLAHLDLAQQRRGLSTAVALEILGDCATSLGSHRQAASLYLYREGAELIHGHYTRTSRRGTSQQAGLDGGPGALLPSGDEVLADSGRWPPRRSRRCSPPAAAATGKTEGRRVAGPEAEAEHGRRRRGHLREQGRQARRAGARAQVRHKGGRRGDGRGIARPARRDAGGGDRPGRGLSASPGDGRFFLGARRPGDRRGSDPGRRRRLRHRPGPAAPVRHGGNIPGQMEAAEDEPSPADEEESRWPSVAVSVSPDEAAEEEVVLPEDPDQAEERADEEETGWVSPKEAVAQENGCPRPRWPASPRTTRPRTRPTRETPGGTADSAARPPG